MSIVSQVSYSTQATTINVLGEPVRVKPYQIIVWISISLTELPEWDARTPVFPAILDSGNNFTLSMYRTHLIRWAGIQPDRMPTLGAIRLGDQRVPRKEAAIWLHPHAPPCAAAPWRMDLYEGIAIYPDQGETVPHLPLLGLRTLTQNRLDTLISGADCKATIRTARRFWFF